MIARRELVLVYETEAACRERLLNAGFSGERAMEITSYLAQSTDIALEFEEISEACGARDIGFRALPLDEAPAALGRCDPSTTLVWTLTDGIAYFRGGVAPALARLLGLATLGSDDSAFALCQDKFRAGSVLRALGLPVPAAGLARNGEWIVPPPEAQLGYFVKPNRLGSKIGIWADSRCQTAEQALELSRRIHAAYRDEALVQAYVRGSNVRASYLAVSPGAGVEAIGSAFVDSGGDFQTMTDSLALYGDTGSAAKTEGNQTLPELVAVRDRQLGADRSIRRIGASLISGLGLKDVFSMDFRVEPDDTVHLIEFEVCPGLPCFDFRAYCAGHWKMTLPAAMAEAASRRFAGLAN